MACSTIPGRGLYYFLPCGTSIGVVYDIPRPVLYQTYAPGVKGCFLETASPRLHPLLLPLTRKNLTISPLPRPISNERCIGVVRGSRVVSRNISSSAPSPVFAHDSGSYDILLPFYIEQLPHRCKKGYF